MFHRAMKAVQDRFNAWASAVSSVFPRKARNRPKYSRMASGASGRVAPWRSKAFQRSRKEPTAFCGAVIVFTAPRGRLSCLEFVASHPASMSGCSRSCRLVAILSAVLRFFADRVVSPRARGDAWFSLALDSCRDLIPFPTFLECSGSSRSTVRSAIVRYYWPHSFPTLRYLSC
jgi:hypothetical protein